jgi:hypothetical protein
VIEWIRRAPRWVVMLLLPIAAVLLFVGAVSHISDLVRHGLQPYGWAPSWLNMYWSSLAVFDPLATVLLLRGKRAGVDLACAIMATDVAANWYAAHAIHHSDLFDQPGLHRLTAFAVLVLGSAPFTRRHLDGGI